MANLNPGTSKNITLKKREQQEIDTENAPKVMADRKLSPEHEDLCVAEIDKERRAKYDEDAKTLKQKTPTVEVPSYTPFTRKNIFASKIVEKNGKKYLAIVSDDAQKYYYETSEDIQEVETSPSQKKGAKLEHTQSTSQTASNISGQNIQAGRDVNIFTQSEPAQQKPKKKSFWSLSSALLVAAASVATVLAYFGISPMLCSPKSSHFFGEVRDAHGEGVAEAQIEVRAQIDAPIIGLGKTSIHGAFNFQIKAKHEATVYITVARGDSVGFEGYQTIVGNHIIPFKPFKKKT